MKKKRVHTPTIIQMEAIECGAVSLSIVLSYYKKFVPLEELRTLCGVTRDGATALQIVRGAKKLGMKAEGNRFEIEDLPYLRLPFIVFWNFNHFVVVEGIGKDFYYINDPATGPRKVSYDEFDKAFTGVAITLSPSEQFQKSGKTLSLFEMAKVRLEGTKNSLLFLFLATFGISLSSLIMPIFTQLYFDKMIFQEMSTFAYFVSFLAVIFVATGFNWLQKSFLTYLNAKLSIKWASRLFWHLLRLPMQFFLQRYPSEIVNRMFISDSAIQKLTTQIFLCFCNLLFTLLYLFLMVQINFYLTLLVVFFACFNIASIVYVNRSRKDAYARMQQNYGKNLSMAFGMFRNIETLKASGMENALFSKWLGHFFQVSSDLQEISIKDSFLTTIPTFLFKLINAIFLIVATYQVLTTPLTIGMMLALEMLILNFYFPFVEVVNISQVVQETKIELERIDDVLLNKEDPLLQNRITSDTKELRLEGRIDLKNITFGYDPNAEALLNDFSMMLLPGKSVAIIGSIGCGKSTLFRLLTNLYEPWSGEIIFDEKNRNAISQELVMRSLAAVDQNIFIFEGSFKDNITLWDETIYEEDLIKAAKDACLHDDILMRENGYRSLILEEGKNLSGGQRQRIEIARALVRKPSILLLDEATASLDSITEQKILRNIQNRGCSCFIVTHRLSTVKNCDEIIFLKKGVIAEKGSHEELLKQKGLYYSLVEAQGL